MKLYNYFRSSASFRVRMALALKGIAYDYVPIHIARGEHKADGFAAISADQLVPLLDDGGVRISQSMAIIEYLEEAYPQTPRLLPAGPAARAQVRAMAQSVACEIHPLNNLRVLKYLSNELAVSEAQKNTWYRHWCRSGLQAFERQLERAAPAERGPFCFGATPTLADCCLVPQIFNAKRFDTPLDGLPLTMGAFDAAMALPQVQAAQPSRAPDAE